MLVETARLWDDLGFYDDDGEFHIHGVTGPDEYTTVVNDNAYTNLMARVNLATPPRRSDGSQPSDPRRMPALCLELGLDPPRPTAWERAADAMHVPHDPVRDITPQDDTLPEPRGLGPRTARRRKSSRCCCTTTRSSSTATR